MIGNGCVIAIGGNEDKRGNTRESILAAFVRRAGGEDARLVIIPSASVQPEERVARYSRLFTRFGAGEVRAVHAERGVTSEERDAIRSASGIFITGGDQVRLMAFLRAGDCVEAIREAVRGGAVYAGTSAGASAASMLMIARSKRKKGADQVEYAAGLGLIPDAIIDQHFAQRQRLSRLIHAAREHRLTGIGIDENTAIVWNHDGIVVEGAGEVTIVDPEHRLDQTARRYRLEILRSGAKR